MKLTQFSLYQERQWEEECALSGNAAFTAEGGNKITTTLSPTQVEVIAATVAEMLLVHTRRTGKELGAAKITFPKTDNLLEAS